ncbi:cell division protein FtsZ, partial [Escherichia coli]|nr:cell division protein FtsZ [Escherichia coli]
ESISLIHQEADEDANIIFGTVFDEDMKDSVKITVIATGFDNYNQVALPQSTFAGNAQAVGSTVPSPYNPLDVKKDEDINVPTFIRRQAD